MRATAAFGHEQPFIGAIRNGRFPIRKRTFEPIAAVQNDLFVGYVGFGISKRKKMPLSDFVA